jgi:hypothetical protein
MRTSTTGTLCSLSLMVSLSMAAPAWSQERVGVVTTVVGPVTVARASAAPAPLKFKDDIFLRDRVTTGDDAITRILLGGKVIVTARERSTLTITEVPGLSTIDLMSGRIAVAVDKTRMKPGERVDVRTPNAIAGVRGTVLVVETLGNTSTVTVLRGLVDVVRLDRATGRAIGPVTPVGAQQAVSVRNNVLPPRPQAITPVRAQDLSREFTPPMRPVATSAVMPVKDEVARASRLLDTMLAPAPPGADTPTGAPARGASSPPTASLATPTLGTAPTVSTTPVLTSSPTLNTTAPLSTTTTTLVPPTLTTAIVSPTITSTTTIVAPPPPSTSQSLLRTVVKPVTGLVK